LRPFIPRLEKANQATTQLGLNTTKERWGAYQLYDGDEGARHGICHSIFIMGGIA